jgi:hypothetical protein
LFVVLEFGIWDVEHGNRVGVSTYLKGKKKEESK